MDFEKLLERQIAAPGPARTGLFMFQKSQQMCGAFEPVLQVRAQSAYPLSIQACSRPALAQSVDQVKKADAWVRLEF
jgi:hypothetical protein